MTRIRTIASTVFGWAESLSDAYPKTTKGLAIASIFSPLAIFVGAAGVGHVLTRTAQLNREEYKRTGKKRGFRGVTFHDVAQGACGAALIVAAACGTMDHLSEIGDAREDARLSAIQSGLDACAEELTTQPNKAKAAACTLAEVPNYIFWGSHDERQIVTMEPESTSGNTLTVTADIHGQKRKMSFKRTPQGLIHVSSL